MSVTNPFKKWNPGSATCDWCADPFECPVDDTVEPEADCAECVDVEGSDFNAPLFYHAIMPVITDADDDSCGANCTDLSEEVYELELGNAGGFITFSECYWGYTNSTDRYVQLERQGSLWLFRASTDGTGCLVALWNGVVLDDPSECMESFLLSDDFVTNICTVTGSVSIVPGPVP